MFGEPKLPHQFQKLVLATRDVNHTVKYVSSLSLIVAANEGWMQSPLKLRKPINNCSQLSTETRQTVYAAKSLHRYWLGLVNRTFSRQTWKIFWTTTRNYWIVYVTLFRILYACQRQRTSRQNKPDQPHTDHETLFLTVREKLCPVEQAQP